MLQGGVRNHTDGAPACRGTGVDEGRLAAFEYQPLKGKTKTPVDDSGRATSLSVGQPWLQLLNLRVKGYIF